MKCARCRKRGAAPYQYESGKRETLCLACLRKVWASAGALTADEGDPAREIFISLGAPIRGVCRLYISGGDCPESFNVRQVAGARVRI
jgi:hypothetical protein